jgi:hypothetical protein
MLDHLNTHGREARLGQQPSAQASLLVSAMPAWQVDAALSDLERSLRRLRAPSPVSRMLTYALVMVLVLSAVVLLVAGHPVVGVALGVSAVLLADGRPLRHLRKIRLGHGSGAGSE